jgi:hypothetical protein
VWIDHKKACVDVTVTSPCSITNEFSAACNPGSQFGVKIRSQKSKYKEVLDQNEYTLIPFVIGYPQGTIIINEDNQAKIKISHNPQDHKRTKHIQVKYRYIKDQIKDAEFCLVYIKTIDQLADVFTKGLHGPRLLTILTELGLTRGVSVTGR